MELFSITAGRKDDAKKKYPHHGGYVDLFAEADPSGRNKYLMWAMKELVENQRPIDDIIELMRAFDQNQNRLQERDINKWDFEALADELKLLQQFEGDANRARSIQNGAQVVKRYPDGARLVKINNHDAAEFYGKDTEWCVSNPSGKYWKEYTDKGSEFWFYLGSKNDTKLAIQRARGENHGVPPGIHVWNANDIRIVSQPWGVRNADDTSQPTPDAVVRSPQAERALKLLPHLMEDADIKPVSGDEESGDVGYTVRRKDDDASAHVINAANADEALADGVRHFVRSSEELDTVELEFGQQRRTVSGDVLAEEFDPVEFVSIPVVGPNRSSYAWPSAPVPDGLTAEEFAQQRANDEQAPFHVYTGTTAKAGDVGPVHLPHFAKEQSEPVLPEGWTSVYRVVNLGDTAAGTDTFETREEAEAAAQIAADEEGRSHEVWAVIITSDGSKWRNVKIASVEPRYDLMFVVLPQLNSAETYERIDDARRNALRRFRFNQENVEIWIARVAKEGNEDPIPKQHIETIARSDLDVRYTLSPEGRDVVLAETLGSPDELRTEAAQLPGRYTITKTTRHPAYSQVVLRELFEIVGESNLVTRTGVRTVNDEVVFLVLESEDAVASQWAQENVGAYGELQVVKGPYDPVRQEFVDDVSLLEEVDNEYEAYAVAERNSSDYGGQHFPTEEAAIEHAQELANETGGVYDVDLVTVCLDTDGDVEDVEYGRTVERVEPEAHDAFGVGLEDDDEAQYDTYFELDEARLRAQDMADEHEVPAVVIECRVTSNGQIVDTGSQVELFEPEGVDGYAAVFADGEEDVGEQHHFLTENFEQAQAQAAAIARQTQRTVVVYRVTFLQNSRRVTNVHDIESTHAPEPDWQILYMIVTDDAADYADAPQYGARWRAVPAARQMADRTGVTHYVDEVQTAEIDGEDVYEFRERMDIVEPRQQTQAAVNVVDEDPESHDDLFWDVDQPGQLNTQDTAFPTVTDNNDPDGADPWAYRRKREGGALDNHRFVTVTYDHVATSRARTGRRSVEDARRASGSRGGGVVTVVAGDLGLPAAGQPRRDRVRGAAVRSVVSTPTKRDRIRVDDRASGRGLFEVRASDLPDVRRPSGGSGRVTAKERTPRASASPSRRGVRAVPGLHAGSTATHSRHSALCSSVHADPRSQRGDGSARRVVAARDGDVPNAHARLKATRPQLIRAFEAIGGTPRTKNHSQWSFPGVLKQVGLSHGQGTEISPKSLINWIKDAVPQVILVRALHGEENMTEEELRILRSQDWGVFGDFREPEPEAKPLTDGELDALTDEVANKILDDDRLDEERAWEVYDEYQKLTDVDKKRFDRTIDPKVACVRQATPYGWELGDLTEEEDPSLEAPQELTEAFRWSESYSSENQYEDPNLKLGRVTAKHRGTDAPRTAQQRTPQDLLDAIEIETIEDLQRPDSPVREVEFAATVEGKQLGYLDIMINQLNQARVEGVSVAPGLRGLGIGRKLYEAALAYARDNDLWLRPDMAVSDDARRVWHSIRKDPSVSRRIMEDRADPIVNEDLKEDAPRDWSRQTAPELYYEYRKAMSGNDAWVDPQGNWHALSSEGTKTHAVWAWRHLGWADPAKVSEAMQHLFNEGWVRVQRPDAVQSNRLDALTKHVTQQLAGETNRSVWIETRLDGLHQYDCTTGKIRPVKFARSAFVLVAGRVDDLVAEFPSVDEQLLRSVKPGYVDWVRRQLNAGEDPDAIVEAVQTFDRVKQRLEQKDLNQYADPASVIEAAALVPQSRRERREEGAEHIADLSGPYKLIKVTTFEASCLYGSNTRWCTTGEDRSHWDEYAQHGVNMYYIVGGPEKYAIAEIQGTAQAFDQLNHDIPLTDAPEPVKEALDLLTPGWRENTVIKWLVGGWTVDGDVRAHYVDTEEQADAWIARMSDDLVGGTKYFMSVTTERQFPPPERAIQYMLDNEQVMGEQFGRMARAMRDNNALLGQSFGRVVQARGVQAPERDTQSRTYYHGTPAYNIPAIVQEGLKAQDGAQFAPAVAGDPQLHKGGGVYLTHWLENAVRYGLALDKSQEPAVVEVEVPEEIDLLKDKMDDPSKARYYPFLGSHGSPFFESPPGVHQWVYPGDIPPEWIKAVHMPRPKNWKEAPNYTPPGLVPESIEAFHLASSLMELLNDADGVDDAIQILTNDSAVEQLDELGIQVEDWEFMEYYPHEWESEDEAWDKMIQPIIDQLDQFTTWETGYVGLDKHDTQLERMSPQDAAQHAVNESMEREAQARQPTVAVDLDGTLLMDVDYDTPPEPSGQPALSPPQDGAAGAMASFDDLGWRVLIFTARFSKATSQAQAEHMREEIDDHLRDHGVHFDEIVLGPKPVADVYIDDKAQPFTGDWWSLVKDVTTRKQAHSRTANRRIKRKFGPRIHEQLEPILELDQGAGTQYGPWLLKYLSGEGKDAIRGPYFDHEREHPYYVLDGQKLDMIEARIKDLDEAAKYLGVDPKLVDNVEPTLKALSDYDVKLHQQMKSRLDTFGEESEAKFTVHSPNVVETHNYDAACFLHGKSSGGRIMPWCGGSHRSNFETYSDASKRRFIVYPNGPETTVTINKQKIPWSPYAYTVSVDFDDDPPSLYNINDPENRYYGRGGGFDEAGAEKALALVNDAVGTNIDMSDLEEQKNAVWEDHGVDPDNWTMYTDEPEVAAEWNNVGVKHGALAQLFSDYRVDPSELVYSRGWGDQESVLPKVVLNASPAEQAAAAAAVSNNVDIDDPEIDISWAVADAITRPNLVNEMFTSNYRLIRDTLNMDTGFTIQGPELRFLNRILDLAGDDVLQNDEVNELIHEGRLGELIDEHDSPEAAANALLDLVDPDNEEYDRYEPPAPEPEPAPRSAPQVDWDKWADMKRAYFVDFSDYVRRHPLGIDESLKEWAGNLKAAIDAGERAMRAGEPVNTDFNVEAFRKAMGLNAFDWDKEAKVYHGSFEPLEEQPEEVREFTADARGGTRTAEYLLPRQRPQQLAELRRIYELEYMLSQMPDEHADRRKLTEELNRLVNSQLQYLHNVAQYWYDTHMPTTGQRKIDDWVEQLQRHGRIVQTDNVMRRGNYRILIDLRQEIIDAATELARNHEWTEIEDPDENIRARDVARYSPDNWGAFRRYTDNSESDDFSFATLLEAAVERAMAQRWMGETELDGNWVDVVEEAVVREVGELPANQRVRELLNVLEGGWPEDLGGRIVLLHRAVTTAHNNGPLATRAYGQDAVNVLSDLSAGPAPEIESKVQKMQEGGRIEMPTGWFPTSPDDAGWVYQMLKDMPTPRPDAVDHALAQINNLFFDGEADRRAPFATTSPPSSEAKQFVTRMLGMPRGAAVNVADEAHDPAIEQPLDWDAEREASSQLTAAPRWPYGEAARTDEGYAILDNCPPQDGAAGAMADAYRRRVRAGMSEDDAWVDPEGTWHKLDDMRSHKSWAQRYTGLRDGGVQRLFNAGWVRVAVPDSVEARRLTPLVRRVAKTLAADHGRQVFIETDDGTHVYDPDANRFRKDASTPAAPADRVRVSA